MKQVNKGFTLIELLVVISIIGLLSSVVLSSLNLARKKARDAVRVSALYQISLALRLYADTNGDYPSYAANSWSSSICNPTCWPQLQPYLTSYLPVMPKDPLNVSSTLEGHHYLYYIRPDSAWITTNGSWAQLSAACAGKTLLVAYGMEGSGPFKKDCASYDTNASVTIMALE